VGIFQIGWHTTCLFFKSTLDVFSANPSQPWTWNQTEAIVIACESEPLDLELALLYVPKVTYEFSANGEEFHCTKMIREKPSFARSSKMLEQFKRGTKIRVMYNPESPLTHLVKT
jgi:hypothetical protein